MTRKQQERYRCLNEAADMLALAQNSIRDAVSYLIVDNEHSILTETYLQKAAHQINRYNELVTEAMLAKGSK